MEHNHPTLVTFIVKHLPDSLPLDTLKRLFSHYGASDVRPCSAGRLKNCAFVDFTDESLAARAQSQLHRLRFLGKILAVERARPYSDRKTPQVPGFNKDGTDSITDSKAQATKEAAPPLPPYSQPQEDPPLPSIDDIPQSRSGMPIHKIEPIAPSLGVDYPFPPHLEYAYPPPDGNILTNVVNALIAVPRFYTQVLHLMNKMNLPAPFRPALPTPPLPPPLPVPSPPKRQARELSSDESELESSEENDQTASGYKKRRVEGAEIESGKGQFTKKRAKVEMKGVEDTGPKPTSLVPSEKPVIKKRQPVLQINISTRGLSESIQDKAEQEKGEIGVEVADEMVKEGITEARTSATREELKAGKMPVSEILALPMFKSYAVGNPTPVLYIKNLAKDIVQDDLFYVFGAFFTNIEDAKAHLGIKLMQEGRMRGQAFITFPSTELAEDALNIAHGYVLKGKPMIIQFGRNPSTAKASVEPRP